MAINWQSTCNSLRRLGRERGAITQDWGGRLSVALVYPNTYFVGMSSLGYQLVYRLFNRQTDFLCERAFLDGSGTILSLESQRPLSDFVAIAFSVSFELDYFGIVQALRRAGLPLWASERDEGHPLVIAGGPCITANPEPVAPFCDALVAGEAEVVVSKLASAIQESTQSSRAEQLEALARIPGVYVPALRRPGSNQQVHRQWVRHLDDWPATSAIQTPDTELGETLLLEVMRGCGRGCRFCLAGFCYRPPRPRSVSNILQEVDALDSYIRRVGLVGAAVSDHPQIDALVEGLRDRRLPITVSSLRADTLTAGLLKGLADSGARTVTIAPEAGSERLRMSVNKLISDEVLITTVAEIGRWRFPQIKLYFMAGLPGETEEDTLAIADLVNRMRQALDATQSHTSIAVNLAPFVPKAQTPYEREPMMTVPDLKGRLGAIRQALRQNGVRAPVESVEWAAVQGVLARGDQRLARVLAAMPALTLAAWRQAMMQEGIDAGEYLNAWSPEKPLPWRFIDTGVHPAYTDNEARRAKVGESCTPCEPGWCQRCGVCS